MAKTIYIVDSEFNNGTTCTMKYNKAYKKSADPDYIDAGEQLSSPIIIDGVDDDTSYDIRITRTCCDGVVSPPSVTTVLTTLTKEIIGITFSGVTSSTITVNWTHSGATPYPDTFVLERSLSPTFSNPVKIYKGATMSFADTGLTASTTYYYRVLGIKNGYLGSIWISNSQATT